MSINITDDIKQSSKDLRAQGLRLKRLRNLLNLSQADFARAMGYSRAAINYWENAQNGGLTAEGALRSIKICQQLGVTCRLEWLLFGEGSPPYLQGEVTAGVVGEVLLKSAATPLAAEIAIFKQYNPSSIIFEVGFEDQFSPFSVGDTVGGHWQSSDNWAYKGRIVALIEEQKSKSKKTSLSLCCIQLAQGKNFLKINAEGKPEKDMLLEKFVHVIRWWGR